MYATVMFTHADRPIIQVVDKTKLLEDAVATARFRNHGAAKHDQLQYFGAMPYATAVLLSMRTLRG